MAIVPPKYEGSIIDRGPVAHTCTSSSSQWTVEARLKKLAADPRPKPHLHFQKFSVRSNRFPGIADQQVPQKNVPGCLHDKAAVCCGLKPTSQPRAVASKSQMVTPCATAENRMGLQGQLSMGDPESQGSQLQAPGHICCLLEVARAVYAALECRSEMSPTSMKIMSSRRIHVRRIYPSWQAAVPVKSTVGG